MKTSSRPREIGGSFASRRGHGTKLSISDSSHHVTEAIGDMYGDDDDYNSKREARPLSFITSPQESIGSASSYSDPISNSRQRPPPTINGSLGKKAHTSPAMLQNSRGESSDQAQRSPSLPRRDRNVSDPATAQFPLPKDIDYGSDPTTIAQELNNLQALRRMSMDVGSTSDPDLPSFQGVSLMPSVAPTGDDDEDDPSRLFWVPARVHPELAPMEFKTFLENRVQTIKRRSGEQTSLSPDSLDRSDSAGGLRRKKSMLSRQINNDGGRGAIGYKDGAEQLERKKSLSFHHAADVKISDLQELDALVKDPSKAMQKLSLEMESRPTDGDMPILPQAPGLGLKRSTHTTYRRGSLRKGERIPFSKRAGSIRGENTEGEESPATSPVEGRALFGNALTRVQSEPTTTENFSRPNRGARRLQNISQPSTISPSVAPENILHDVLGTTDANSSKAPLNDALHSSKSDNPPRTSSYPRIDIPVPLIVETPPPPEEPAETQTSKGTSHFPERSSSQSQPTQQSPIVPEPPARSIRRPGMDRQSSSSHATPRVSATPSQTLDQMAQHPSPLPGNSGGTDSLTFIPTLVEKKSDKKGKREKDEESGSRKPSWGWFKGSDEKDKKEKKKDEDKEAKKSKAKVVVEKAHDNARLDVLQSTMDIAVPRGRESLLLDRDSVDNKLQDERKKDTSRRSGEGKKEKDGLFSSLFGGGKKKGDRDSGGKKGSSLRTISPEPPQRELKPDIDYNWTRFSMLEERAIYRMAHIKLANPRRALYSQVLLSNFMYSYLAKVQQMHPQMQIPQSALQKKQEAERQQKEQEQRYREEQQQRQAGGEQYRYDYHQGIAQYAESQDQDQDHKTEGVNYVDDSQIYDYDHQDDESTQGHDHRPQSRAAQHIAGNGYSDQNQDYGHYSYGQSDGHDHQNEDDDEDMW